MSFHPKLRQQQAGFTLIEIAIVLAIISLVLGGLLSGLPTQLQNQRINATKTQLVEIKQALISHAVAYGRLPCPASLTSDGMESFNPGNSDPQRGGECTNALSGYVPAATLGLQSNVQRGYAVDGWGRKIRYAVTPTNLTGATETTATILKNAFTSLGQNGEAFNGATIDTLAKALTETASSQARYQGLLVCSTSQGIQKIGKDQDCSSTGQQVLTRTAVVVIFSEGRPGTGSALGADENENLNDNDRFFVSHEPRDADGTGGAFHQLVDWVTFPEIAYRMSQAGRLF